jgi:hypothetical protein
MEGGGRLRSCCVAAWFPFVLHGARKLLAPSTCLFSFGRANQFPSKKLKFLGNLKGGFCGGENSESNSQETQNQKMLFAISQTRKSEPSVNVAVRSK